MSDTGHRANGLPHGGRWSLLQRTAGADPGRKEEREDAMASSESLSAGSMAEDAMYRSEEAAMTRRMRFSTDEARSLGLTLGVRWEESPFDVEQFRQGLDVELEHGRRDTTTNVTDDDPLLTAKIALAQLRELPDYYTRLASMEAE
jgi:hypothetical protein